MPWQSLRRVSVDPSSDHSELSASPALPFSVRCTRTVPSLSPAFSRTDELVALMESFLPVVLSSLVAIPHELTARDTATAPSTEVI